MPPSNQILSRHEAFKYALVTSSARTSRSFKPAIKNANRTLSRETTFEYVIDPGVSVVCPPATNLAFRVKSVLTSKIIWHETNQRRFLTGSCLLGSYSVCGLPCNFHLRHFLAQGLSARSQFPSHRRWIVPLRQSSAHVCRTCGSFASIA
jgi:hypothetical protein